MRSTQSRRPQARLNLTLLASALLASSLLSPALAAGPAAPLPTGMQVVQGQASVMTQGPLLTVRNTPNAILNWQSFSIGAGNSVYFDQASASSKVLNRVVGNDPSQIFGSLGSNGQVWLLNPNGVLFGASARVDVGSLVVSTLRLNDDDFLAGRFSFTALPGMAATLRNEGQLKSSFGGQIALLGAGDVENTGSVEAPGGRIDVIGAQSVDLVDTGLPNLAARVSKPAGQALNLGRLAAAGGLVDVYAATVNQEGYVKADSLGLDAQGQVVLRASDTLTLGAGSETTADGGAGKGGRVELLGRRVALLDGARVDASGDAGGGSIFAGGGAAGRDASLPNAQALYMGAGASLRADARVLGDGGNIVLWSDQATRAYGSFSARGGLLGGNGGALETSGGWLDARPTALNLSAGKGQAGMWLLDPNNITINDAGPDQNVGTGPVFTSTNDASVIATATIIAALNAGNSVTISTGTSGSNSQAGDILMDGAHLNAGPNAAVSLNLNAHRDIVVRNSTIASAAQSLSLVFSSAGSGVGAIWFEGSTVNTAGGNITLQGSGPLDQIPNIDGSFSANLYRPAVGYDPAFAALPSQLTIPSAGIYFGQSSLDLGTGVLQAAGTSAAEGGIVITQSSLRAATLDLAGWTTLSNRSGIYMISNTTDLVATKNLKLYGSGGYGLLVHAGARLTLDSAGDPTATMTLTGIGTERGVAIWDASLNTVSGYRGTPLTVKSGTVNVYGTLAGSASTGIGLQVTGNFGTGIPVAPSLDLAGASAVSFYGLAANTAKALQITQARVAGPATAGSSFTLFGDGDTWLDQVALTGGGLLLLQATRDIEVSKSTITSTSVPLTTELTSAVSGLGAIAIVDSSITTGGGALTLGGGVSQQLPTPGGGFTAQTYKPAVGMTPAQESAGPARINGGADFIGGIAVTGSNIDLGEGLFKATGLGPYGGIDVGATTAISARAVDWVGSGTQGTGISIYDGSSATSPNLTPTLAASESLSLAGYSPAGAVGVGINGGAIVSVGDADHPNASTSIIGASSTAWGIDVSTSGSLAQSRLVIGSGTATLQGSATGAQPAVRVQDLSSNSSTPSVDFSGAQSVTITGSNPGTGLGVSLRNAYVAAPAAGSLTLNSTAGALGVDNTRLTGGGSLSLSGPRIDVTNSQLMSSGQAFSIDFATTGASPTGMLISGSTLTTGGGNLQFGASQNVCSTAIGCTSTAAPWIESTTSGTAALSLVNSSIDAGAGRVEGGGAVRGTLQQTDGLSISGTTISARDILLAGRTDAGYGLQTLAGTKLIASHLMWLDGLIDAAATGTFKSAVFINDGTQLSVRSPTAEADAALNITGTSISTLVGRGAGVQLHGAAGAATETKLVVEGGSLSITGRGGRWGVLAEDLVQGTGGNGNGLTFDASLARPGASVRFDASTTLASGPAFGFFGGKIYGPSVASPGSTVSIIGSGPNLRSSFDAGLWAAVPVVITDTGQLTVSGTIIETTGGITLQGDASASPTWIGVNLRASQLSSNGVGDQINVTGPGGAAAVGSSDNAGVEVNGTTVSAPAGSILLSGQGSAAGGRAVNLVGSTLTAQTVTVSGIAPFDGDGITVTASVLGALPTVINATNLNLTGDGADSNVSNPTHLGVNLLPGTVLNLSGQGVSSINSDRIDLTSVTVQGDAASLSFNSQGNVFVNQSTFNASTGPLNLSLLAAGNGSEGTVEIYNSTINTNGGSLLLGGAGPAQHYQLPDGSSSAAAYAFAMGPAANMQGITITTSQIDLGSGSFQAFGIGNSVGVGLYSLSLQAGTVTAVGSATDGDSGVTFSSNSTITASQGMQIEGSSPQQGVTVMTGARLVLNTPGEPNAVLGLTGFGKARGILISDMSEETSQTYQATPIQVIGGRLQLLGDGQGGGRGVDLHSMVSGTPAAITLDLSAAAGATVVGQNSVGDGVQLSSARIAGPAAGQMTLDGGTGAASLVNVDYTGGGSLAVSGSQVSVNSSSLRAGVGLALNLSFASSGAEANGVSIFNSTLTTGGDDIIFGRDHQVCSTLLGCASGRWAEGPVSLWNSTVDAGAGAIRGGGAATSNELDGLWIGNSTLSARDIVLTGRSDGAWGVAVVQGSNLSSTHILSLDGVGAGTGSTTGEGGVSIDQSTLAVHSAAAEADAALSITGNDPLGKGTSFSTNLGHGVLLTGYANSDGSPTRLIADGASLSITGTGPRQGLLFWDVGTGVGAIVIDASKARAGSTVLISGTSTTPDGLPLDLRGTSLLGPVTASAGSAVSIVGSGGGLAGDGEAALSAWQIATATPVNISSDRVVSLYDVNIAAVGGISMNSTLQGSWAGISVSNAVLSSTGAGDVIRFDAQSGTDLYGSTLTASAGGIVIQSLGSSMSGDAVSLTSTTLTAPAINITGTAQGDGHGINVGAGSSSTVLNATTLNMDGHSADSNVEAPSHAGVYLHDGAQINLSGHGVATLSGDSIAMLDTTVKGDAASLALTTTGSMVLLGSRLDFSAGSGTAVSLTSDADSNLSGRIRLSTSSILTGGGGFRAGGGSGAAVGVYSSDALSNSGAPNTVVRDGGAGILMQDAHIDAGTGAVALNGQGATDGRVVPANYSGTWGLLAGGINSIRGGSISLTGTGGDSGPGIDIGVTTPGATLDLNAGTINVSGGGKGAPPTGSAALIYAGVDLNSASTWTATGGLNLSSTSGSLNLIGASLSAGGALALNSADLLDLTGTTLSAASISATSAGTAHPTMAAINLDDSSLLAGDITLTQTGNSQASAGIAVLDSQLSATGTISLNGRSATDAGVFVDPSRIAAGGVLSIKGSGGSGGGIVLGAGDQLSGSQVTLEGTSTDGTGIAATGGGGIAATQDLHLNGLGSTGVALSGAWQLNATGALAIASSQRLALSSAAGAVPTLKAGSAVTLQIDNPAGVTLGGATDALDASALTAALAGSSSPLTLQVGPGEALNVSAALSVPGKLTLAADEIKLMPGASLSSQAAGDAISLRGVETPYVQSFDNTAGASALSTSRGRWVASFGNPGSVALGGLAADFTLYDAASLELQTDAQGNVVTPMSGNGVFFAAPAPATLGNANSVTVSVEAVLAQVLIPIGMSSPTEGRVLDAMPAFAFDGDSDGLSFRSVNLAQMSRAELMNLLAARDNYKKKLFADTIFKLEEDPGLADVRPCVNEAELQTGDCLITEALKRSILEAREAALRTQQAKLKPSARHRVVKQATLPVIERKVALIIGINRYADKRIPELDSAVPDARAVRDLLELRLGYETVMLEDASKDAIVRAFNEMALQSGPKDSVMIYYAGHGEVLPKTGMGYWLPADTRVDRPTSWLSNVDIARLLAQFSARQVMLISDSCYSGTLAGSERIVVDKGLDAPALLSRKAAVVMSSGGNEPVSDEGRDGHSVFAWHLLNVLGDVSVWQAGGPVFERLRFAVKREFPQTPQYGAAREAGHEGNTDYLFETRELEQAQK